MEEDVHTAEEHISSSCSDNDAEEGPALKLRKGSSPSMCLFRKNGSANTQKIKAKPTSARFRRTPSIPKIPPGFSSASRPVSLLERSLFRGIKPDLVLPVSSPNDQCSKTSQLTIFYAGVINVYDHFPVDKAQAIMLLASQCSSASSSPALVVKDSTKADLIKSVPPSQSPSLCKVEGDLPIARRQSLRHFLDKRRKRIMNKNLHENSNEMNRGLRI